MRRSVSPRIQAVESQKDDPPHARVFIAFAPAHGAPSHAKWPRPAKRRQSGRSRRSGSEMNLGRRTPRRGRHRRAARNVGGGERMPAPPASASNEGASSADLVEPGSTSIIPVAANPNSAMRFSPPHRRDGAHVLVPESPHRREHGQEAVWLTHQILKMESCARLDRRVRKPR